MADAFTENMALDPNSWVKATDGQTFIAVQVNATGRVFARISPTSDDPNDDTDPAAITLGRADGLASQLSMGNLPAGTSLWLTADREMDGSSVVVMAY